MANRFNGFVALPKPLKRLMNEQWAPTTSQLKQGVNENSTYIFLAHCQINRNSIEPDGAQISFSFV